MEILRSIAKLDREIVSRGTFYDFFSMVWPLIDPDPFVPNWHLEEKCIHLEAVSRGDIRKLIINEPPGMGKSKCVSIAWNVWEWIKRPESKFIYASYDASLVGVRDGGRVIRLLESEWFQQRWGNILLKSAKAAASAFETVAGGLRFATSPGGKGTGRHFNIRVIDDPSKPIDAAGGAAFTKKALQKVSEWRKNTFSSRATDIRTVRDVVIMQRLHEDDLAGELLREGGWTHLCLPMLFDPSVACKTQFGGDRRHVKDELLFPERFPLDDIKDLRDNRMGPDVFEAQYQQRPTRKEGGIFKRDWWKFWHYETNISEPCLCSDCFAAKKTLPGHTQTRMCEVLPGGGTEAQSWDCTFKRTDHSDYVAGGLFKFYLSKVYLIDCVNKRLSFIETVDEVRKMSLRYPRAYDKLIEDKANGPAVQNVLSREIEGIVLINPMGGKEARANAGSLLISSGRFFLPHPSIATWVWSFMQQHESFPRGVNDDMVDMTSQFLSNIKTHGQNFSNAMKKIRSL